MPDVAAPTAPNPALIGFRYVWTVKPTMRQLSPTEAIVLQVSPKFATVHSHVSFQWSLKLHGTTGKLNSDDETDEGEENNDVVDYVAVELYYVDGPVNQVDVKAVVGIIGFDHESKEQKNVVEEKKKLTIRRGSGCELSDTDRAQVSDYIKANVGKVIRLSLYIKMAQTLFDPFTYLDAISPTPQESFLTANYNARVNSKIWKKRSRKKSSAVAREHRQHREKEDNKENGVDYEARFREVVEKEQRLREEQRLKTMASRRASAAEMLEHTERLMNGHTDHEHLFKKLLIACCESCERRRASMTTEGETTDDDDCDAEEDSFECSEQGKEHIHDLLANMYFSKVVLPEMEYVEDFVDFLIECELNDLPVLKRACERYLCCELNTKQDLVTSLLLDMLFISIVFNLNVMKSMTLSELSSRTEDIMHPDKLMEEEEYKNLDKRIRSLSDRNLIELIEQCQAFREQRLRVTTVLS